MNPFLCFSFILPVKKPFLQKINPTNMGRENMSEKPQRHYRIFLAYALLFLLGCILIFFGYFSILQALSQMQQNPGLMINYSPAYSMVVIGIALLFFGPIHFLYERRIK
jgi:hypothetical protein